MVRSLSYLAILITLHSAKLITPYHPKTHLAQRGFFPCPGKPGACQGLRRPAPHVAACRLPMLSSWRWSVSTTPGCVAPAGRSLPTAAPAAWWLTSAAGRACSWRFGLTVRNAVCRRKSRSTCRRKPMQQKPSQHSAAHAWMLQPQDNRGGVSAAFVCRATTARAGATGGAH